MINIRIIKIKKNTGPSLIILIAVDNVLALERLVNNKAIYFFCHISRQNSINTLPTVPNNSIR